MQALDPTLTEEEHASLCVAAARIDFVDGYTPPADVRKLLDKLEKNAKRFLVSLKDVMDEPPLRDSIDNRTPNLHCLQVDARALVRAIGKMTRPDARKGNLPREAFRAFIEEASEIYRAHNRYPAANNASDKFIGFCQVFYPSAKHYAIRDALRDIRGK